MQSYLIKLGEISLKGNNRTLFEKKLKTNLKDKLRPTSSNIVTRKGRVFLDVPDDVSEDRISRILSRTYGIDGWAPCLSCPKDMAEITELALRVTSRATTLAGEKKPGSFKVAARREDKSFEKNSYEIECELGAAIQKANPGLIVDVKKPDYVLAVEIRDKAYIYPSSRPGLRGLPVGTAGKGLLLLSGGIDSPVAGAMMASRGLRCEALYFHAHPYTGPEAKEKVKTLSRILAPYNSGIKLNIVNFTPIELVLKDKVPEELKTLSLRAAMIQTANLMCRETGAGAIVTGESLSQVASQTLSAMSLVNDFAEYPVLRPLVGVDKMEIIRRAQALGTYETSILPFADCCVLFSPDHPCLNPNKDRFNRLYATLELEGLIKECVLSREIVEYPASED